MQNKNKNKKKSFKPCCKLIGTDGNAFAIIGKVIAVLQRHGTHDEASVFKKQTTKCMSYDELLVLCMETVNVHCEGCDECD